ncbi:MAG: hypothetical protein AAGE61_18570 [Pseudomonadota bacterium]
MSFPIKIALILALLPSVAHAQDLPPLPSLNLEPTATTVSGLSSGGFMAVQLQVAYSKRIAGAGIIAGGPYDCADGFLTEALLKCMGGQAGGPDATESVKTIGELAGEGLIDPSANLGPDQIYLFHGESDDTVARVTMDVLRDMYLEFGVPEGKISYETGKSVGHGFVVKSSEPKCGIVRPDFLIDCDFDQAGDILKTLYGTLDETGSQRDDGIVLFDQARYLQGAVGMDDIAFVYIPEACESGEECRLHIALHGCKQGHDTIQETYVRFTGYNRWAEANNIVVLYPQAKKIPLPIYNWFGWAEWLGWINIADYNPNGCWDWWGFSGDDYVSRDAPQNAAIARMAEALGAPLSE